MSLYHIPFVLRNRFRQHLDLHITNHCVPFLPAYSLCLPLLPVSSNYNIKTANTAPITAAPNDVLNSLPLTAAPLPPPALTVGDGAGLPVGEVVLFSQHISIPFLPSAPNEQQIKRSTHPLVVVAPLPPLPPVPAELVAADPADDDTETPGNSVPRHKVGTVAAKKEIWSAGQALMQVIRFWPIRDWHSHWSSAAPVSVPSQKEATGELVSQEATQGGVVSARERGRRTVSASVRGRGRRADFILVYMGGWFWESEIGSVFWKLWMKR